MLSGEARRSGCGGWLHALLAFAGGVLLSLPFLHPWLRPLGWVAPIPWLLLLSLPGRRLDLLAVYGGAVAFLLLALHWIASVHVVVWIMTSFYYATAFALFAWAYRRSRARLGLPAVLLAPVLWSGAEILCLEVYGFGVTWLDLGALLAGNPWLAQVADLTGVSGLTVILVAVAGWVTDAILAWIESGPGALVRPRIVIGAAALAAILVACLLYGALRIRSLDLYPGPRVALVQGAVSPAVKAAEGGERASFDRHASLTRSADLGGVDLVVWPEGSLPLPLDGEPGWLEEVKAVARGIGRPLLVGAHGYGWLPDGETRFTNSAYLFPPGSEIAARWDKRVLVPVGETLLWFERWPGARVRLARFLRDRLHFNPVMIPGRETVVAPIGEGGPRIGVLICYDDAVPGPARALRDAGADLLLVLSNEAWFPDAELVQHLDLARLRAIETRSPLLRATNTGVTAAVDPGGRITASIPRGAPAVLVVPAERTSLRPPPAWVPVVFRRAVLALGLLAILGSFVPRRRKVVPPESDPESPRSRAAP